jgi:hypothetical protein
LQKTERGLRMRGAGAGNVSRLNAVLQSLSVVVDPKSGTEWKEVDERPTPIAGPLIVPPCGFNNAWQTRLSVARGSLIECRCRILAGSFVAGIEVRGGEQ